MTNPEASQGARENGTIPEEQSAEQLAPANLQFAMAGAPGAPPLPASEGSVGFPPAQPQNPRTAPNTANWLAQTPRWLKRTVAGVTAGAMALGVAYAAYRFGKQKPGEATSPAYNIAALYEQGAIAEHGLRIDFNSPVSEDMGAVARAQIRDSVTFNLRDAADGQRDGIVDNYEQNLGDVYFNFTDTDNPAWNEPAMTSDGAQPPENDRNIPFITFNAAAAPPKPDAKVNIEGIIDEVSDTVIRDLGLDSGEKITVPATSAQTAAEPATTRHIVQTSTAFPTTTAKITTTTKATTTTKKPETAPNTPARTLVLGDTLNPGNMLNDKNYISERTFSQNPIWCPYSNDEGNWAILRKPITPSTYTTDGTTLYVYLDREKDGTYNFIDTVKNTKLGEAPLNTIGTYLNLSSDNNNLIDSAASKLWGDTSFSSEVFFYVRGTKSGSNPLIDIFNTGASPTKSVLANNFKLYKFNGTSFDEINPANY